MIELPDDLIERLYAGAFPVTVWRKHLGLTPNELASRAGMSPSELKRIEEAKRLRGKQGERLAAAMGISADCLRPMRGRWRGCDDALSEELPDE